MIITIFSIILIEGLQHFTSRGSFDIDDIILNVLGVYVGYLIYPMLKKVISFKTNSI